MRRLLVIRGLLLAAFPWACALVPAHSDSPAPIVRGPIPSRTQEPVKLTYLFFRPRRAAIQPEGTTRLMVQSAYSSQYQNGHSGGNDVVFDGEISHTSFAVRHAVSPSTDVELELAVTYATDGFLDQFVEQYHQFFGLPSEGRHNRPLNTYEMDAFHNGVRAYELDGNEPGLADLPVILTQAFVDESKSTPAVSARIGVELPTGSEPRGFGNGKVDCGGGVLAEKTIGRWTATSAVDYVFTGSSRSFEAARVFAQDDLDLQFGLEYRWNDRLSLLFGAVLESPVTRDIGIKEIDGEILSIDIGAAWDAGKHSRFLFDVGEDAVAKSGPDFTVLGGWSYSW